MCQCPVALFGLKSSSPITARRLRVDRRYVSQNLCAAHILSTNTSMNILRKLALGGDLEKLICLPETNFPVSPVILLCFVLYSA